MFCYTKNGVSSEKKSLFKASLFSLSLEDRCLQNMSLIRVLAISLLK